MSIVEKLKTLHDKEQAYRYKVIYDFQANFIILRLKELATKATYENGYVYLQSKKRRDKFKQVIKESLEYAEKQFPLPPNKTTTYFKNGSLICVIINGEKICLTMDNMQKIRYFMFTRELPYIKYLKVFTTKKEMSEALQNEGILI